MKRFLSAWLTLSSCLKLLSKFCWAFLASERCWGEKRTEMTHGATAFILAGALPLSLPTPSPLCAPVSDPAGIWRAPSRCPSSCFRPRALVARRNRWVRWGSPERTRGCWICRRTKSAHWKKVHSWSDYWYVGTSERRATAVHGADFMSEPSGLTPLQERRFIWSHPAVNTKHALFSYLQSSSSLLPRLAYFFVRLLQSESRIVGFNVHNAGHRSKEAHSKENTPELLGVVLLNLRPLLYKFDVELQQVDARLCVLFDLVVLVLWGEQNRVKGHGGIKPRSFALRANSAEGSNRISARSLQAWSWNSTRLLKVQRWVNTIWCEHTGWWMGDFWSFWDQAPCCVWEKLNVLYCQTSADSKSSCFSVTADIHDRLIDDSFFLPEERQQINSFSQRSWVAFTHTSTHAEAQSSTLLCGFTCVPPFSTHKHTCVCSQGGVSHALLSISQETQQQHHPNSLTRPGYPKHVAVSVRFSSGKPLLTLERMQDRADECHLYDWFECVGVCGGCRAEIHREASRSRYRTQSRLGTNQITKDKKTNDGKQGVLMGYTPSLLFVLGGRIMVEQDRECSGMR